MKIRKLTHKERSTLMNLYRYAYTEWSDEQIKDEELEEILVEETLGVFENGRLVSSLRVHDFQQSVRGVLKDCGGLAGVPTYPEARRKGYVRELMRKGFELMRERGQSVSMLDPFKTSFYSQFGYVAANAPYLVEAPLKSLRPLKSTHNDKDWTFERVRAVKAKDPLLRFLRDVGTTRYHGYITFKSIPDEMWKQRVKDSIVIFIRHKGKIEAASRYRLKGERIKGRWQSKAIVFDFLWRNREARSRLFDFFSKHQDQIHNIVIHAPFETFVEHWFEDTRLKVERKTPWMVRVIDVAGAIDNLPGTGNKEITLEVTDAECPWNNGGVSIGSKENRLQVTKYEGTCIVKATIQALSSLVYGTMPLAEIEFQGGITISEEWARPILHSWFPPMPLYNVLYF
jgi:predicted acetyltransferase